MPQWFGYSLNRSFFRDEYHFWDSNQLLNSRFRHRIPMGTF